ncbi:MAG: diacylglycerol kinase family lipid kinase [Deltaproteobacteria bacterium]|nr:diacylglycerol kinase family lipid kinase [Deltaproteobacteria bacterium]
MVKSHRMLRVIHNPVAGPRAAAGIDRIRAFLSARGIPFEILKTSGPGDATVLAREAAHAGAETVIAVGGDGTVNEVANGLAGSSTRLVVVPHGTGNVISREVGLPATVEGCLGLIESGKTIEVPLARAENRYFLLMASAGFDAEVVARMSHRQKNILGMGAYYLAGIRHLVRTQPTLWMEFPDRERMEAQALILCRGKTYGIATMVPDGNLEGRTLKVIALCKTGRWAILRFAIQALRGKHLSSPGVHTRETRSVFVRSRIPSAAQVDGDYLCPLPVRFEMTDTKLRLVVPQEYGARTG